MLQDLPMPSLETKSPVPWCPLQLFSTAALLFMRLSQRQNGKGGELIWDVYVGTNSSSPQMEMDAP